MNCSRFETLLTDYLENTLDSRVRLAAGQHLESCGDCAALLEDVSRLREELGSFPEFAVPDELIERIMERTSGKPRKASFWNDLVVPSIRPLLSQRYAFATVMMFVFLSFAVNVMGPGFSAFSYSRLSPSSLVAKADQIGAQIYVKWREFNEFKGRVAEEINFFKEDLLGRLDYHLVSILFQSYEESLKEGNAGEGALDGDEQQSPPGEEEIEERDQEE